MTDQETKVKAPTLEEVLAIKKRHEDTIAILEAQLNYSRGMVGMADSFIALHQVNKEMDELSEMLDKLGEDIKKINI